MGGFFFLSVDVVGRVGGLVLLWKEESSVRMINFSKQQMTIEVHDEEQKCIWMFTNYYGEPETSKRHLAWQFFQELQTKQLVP